MLNKMWRPVAVAAVAMLVISTATVAKAPVEEAVADDGATHGHQHGGEHGHLAPTSENVTLVGQVTVGGVGEGQIADVAVWGGYAYLASFAQPACNGPESVEDGGVFIVDISDPSAPVEVGFIDSHQDTYMGEGVQVLGIDTAKFSGDLLVQNNEGCGKNSKGGFSLFDVSDPLKPVRLVENFGDRTINGVRALPDVNTIHSAFAWQDGDRAYVVIVDNHETADVDIYDITNPKKPFMVGEHDIVADFPEVLGASDGALGSFAASFFHDVVVKEIGGEQIMLLSYWDAGYVTLNVDDPANPVYIGDSDFAIPDPQLLEQTGDAREPEGNAHQAEFTLDSQYILAADEDFGPSRTGVSTDDGDATDGAQGSDTPPIAIGASLTRTAVYVGRACVGDEAVPAAPADGYVAVATRGFCTFTEKLETIEAAGGYDAAIMVNREGADGCSAFGMTIEGDIPAISVDRETGFALFDVDGFDQATCAQGGDTLAGSLIPGLAIGTVGDEVTLEEYFEGWGYTHLFSNDDGKFVELDTYAIDEAMDPDFATEFGDLSVHEFAASHEQADLAYLSYYSGGFRVIRIVSDEIVEVGHYIADDLITGHPGNNFWGVQVFQHDGRELVAASDRDSGLWIFEYTGP